MKRFGKVLLLSTTSAALSLASAAHAQTATADSQGPASDALVDGEIVVTAQKRAERLQDVPLAVTAVTGEALEARAINDTTNLARLSPSLTYTQSTNPQNSSFRVRGIGTAVFGVGSESSVSVVSDGVVLARATQGFTDLADVERIEVLRGPQGTLFGKNATGGVISIVTARPSRDLTGKVSATVAEEGQYSAKGTISGPLTDNLRLRVSGFYNMDEGVNRNVVLNKRTNGSESWGVRAKVEMDVGDLNLLGAASYSRTVQNCCTWVPIKTDNAALATLLLPVVARPYNMEVGSNLEGDTKITSRIYSLEANYDLGGATLTSITAYQDFDFFNNQDVDGYDTSFPRFAGTSPTAYSQFDVNGGTTGIKNFSQELRLASSGSNALNYVVGGYYDNVTIDRTFQRRVVVCPPVAPANIGLAIGARCPVPIAQSGAHEAQFKSEQIAAFGQVDLRLVGGLKAIAGLRVQNQKIRATGRQLPSVPFAGDRPAFTGDPAICSNPNTTQNLTCGTNRGDDTAVTGKAALQYEFNRNAQAYVSYTRGYKGQSLGMEYNQTFNNNPIVNPETVNAYEIGFKGTTADRTFSIAAAAFLADYRNLQVQANRSDPLNNVILFVTTNAGKARTEGVEIEGTIRPDSNLSLAFSAAYLKTRFDADGIGCPMPVQLAAVTVANGGKQPMNTCYRQTAANGTLSGAVQNVRGGTLPNSPAWRFNFNPRYEREVGGNMKGFLDVNLAFQSRVLFSLEQDQALEQKAYATVDAAIGIRPAGGPGFSASLWVRNLTNSHFYSSVQRGAVLTAPNLTPGNLTAFYTRGASRYFGGTVGYSF